MSDPDELRELYQEVILDHNRRPRNFARPEGTNREAQGFNPLCGDKVTLFAKVEGGILRELGFQGQGCAISTASASMLTESLKGRTEAEVRAIARLFHDMLTAEPGKAKAKAEGLGKLAAFGGVSEFPMRVKCATLAWHTLGAALDGRQDKVSTE